MNTLHHLLDRCAAHDPEYRGGLSDHLPMALVALHALGADDTRLAAYAERYSSRLAPAPPRQSWPDGLGWTTRLGQREAYAAYRGLFRARLAGQRPQALLAEVLPDLMRGCGAAAFHGLIRTAYAVQAQHLGELADGLAYWACRWLGLGELAATAGDEHDPEVLLRRLHVTPSAGGLIFERMRDAASDPQLPPLVAALAVSEQTLPRLARLAAYAYAGSGNFAVLHLLTSAHALRLLLPALAQPAQRLQAVRWYWQAYAAAVAAAAISRRSEPLLLRWGDLVAAALASDDEHVIKLVHSCREQARVYGGVAWRYAASRGVGGASR